MSVILLYVFVCCDYVLCLYNCIFLEDPLAHLKNITHSKAE